MPCIQRVNVHALRFNYDYYYYCYNYTRTNVVVIFCVWRSNIRARCVFACICLQRTTLVISIILIDFTSPTLYFSSKIPLLRSIWILVYSQTSTLHLLAFDGRALKTNTAVFDFKRLVKAKTCVHFTLETTAHPKQIIFNGNPLSFLKTLATNPTNSFSDRIHKCVVCYEIINYESFVIRVIIFVVEPDADEYRVSTSSVQFQR